ncbi:MAG: TetR/AcrR family transcriptional regulator [Polyangiaceae bacterium]
MAAAASGQVGDGLTERDRQREETRRRIREEALSIIRRDGLAEARVDEIARAAGVSRGTVYFHYPTKEHVVAEALGEAEGRVAAVLRELPRTATLAGVLDAFCGAFAREWEREAALFPSVATVAVHQAAATIRSKELDAVHHALAARLKTAAERGELTGSLRPAVLANVFLMSVLTTTLAWSARPRLRLSTVLADAVELFLHGASGSKR